MLVRARGVERYLRYFVALGAGFLMATALLEMTPESLRLSPQAGADPDHGRLLRGASAGTHHQRAFSFGEETHHGEFVSRHTGNSVMAGLSVHALFDGVAIGSGFVVSNWLGWLIFLAIFLHKAPEGFTMASVMLASGRSRSAAFTPRSRWRRPRWPACWSLSWFRAGCPMGCPSRPAWRFMWRPRTWCRRSTASRGFAWRWCFLRAWAAFLLLRMLLPAL